MASPQFPPFGIVHHRRAMSDCKGRRISGPFAGTAATAQLIDISRHYMQSGRQILFPIPQKLLTARPLAQTRYETCHGIKRKPDYHGIFMVILLYFHKIRRTSHSAALTAI